MVVFGQKLIVFGQSGCIRTNVVVYKTFARIKTHKPDWSLFCLNTTTGCRKRTTFARIQPLLPENNQWLYSNTTTLQDYIHFCTNTTVLSGHTATFPRLQPLCPNTTSFARIQPLYPNTTTLEEYNHFFPNATISSGIQPLLTEYNYLTPNTTTFAPRQPLLPNYNRFALIQPVFPE